MQSNIVVILTFATIPIIMGITPLFLDISGGELIFIFLVVFLVFGPKKIPEIARMIGKTMNELKKSTSDLTRELQEGADQVKREVANVKSGITAEVQNLKDEVNVVTTNTKQELNQLVNSVKRDGQPDFSSGNQAEVFRQNFPNQPDLNNKTEPQKTQEDDFTPVI